MTWGVAEHEIQIQSGGYLSGDISSSTPRELVKLAKDLMPRRPSRPPQPFLGEPCGDDALEVSDSSDRRPDAARCLSDI